jgi:hypothetical protein
VHNSRVSLPLDRIDAFYDTTLRPKIDALDNTRRHVRWLISKGLLIVLPAIVVLIGGDLPDGVLPMGWSGPLTVAAWFWLLGGAIFAVAKYFLPGVTAYANYRSRFKQDVVAEIFRAVCPYAAYDPLQGITEQVFDASGSSTPAAGSSPTIACAGASATPPSRRPRSGVHIPPAAARTRAATRSFADSSFISIPIGA